MRILIVASLLIYSGIVAGFGSDFFEFFGGQAQDNHEEHAHSHRSTTSQTQKDDPGKFDLIIISLL
jgi:hypothetical protein